MSVSNSRLIFPNKTYALANVSSVSLNQNQPRMAEGVLAVIVGVLVLVWSLSAFVLSSWTGGIVLVLLGVGCIVLGRKLCGIQEFVVRLRTAGAETQALTTRNGPFARQVVQAIEQAIVMRG